MQGLDSSVTNDWQLCACGRTFSQPSASSNHKRTCPKTKKRLSSALDRAKERWAGNKRRKVNVQVHDPSESANRPLMPGLMRAPSPSIQDSIPPLDLVEHSLDVADDHQIPLLERRQWIHRSNRQRLPARFRDITPQPPPPLASANSQPIITPNTLSAPVHLDRDQIDTDSSPSLAARLGSRLRRIFTTPRNIFGLSRRYEANELPSFDPEQQIALRDLSDIPVCSDSSELKTFYPYPNRSAFELGYWHWNGGAQKSQASFRELIDIIGDPEFQSTDIRNINWDQINEVLGTEKDTGEWLEEDAGWTQTPVTISVPYQSRRGIPSDPGAGPRNYTVDDFHHRSLVSVIREKVSGLSENHQFHFDPYELHWQRDSSVDPIRVQGELYTSPMFIDAHRELQDTPGEPGCDLPRVVVALMFWSDATQLTAFGNAKLWPLYLFFGNDSKYSRCKPTCHLCEHVAYFQMLPDSFKDFASAQTAGGKAPSSAFMTHCHREFFHEQWKVILDDDFIAAWRHGIVISCNGIKRRFYPRIFTYSADYPEKILIASIRNLGTCPCPRCLIPLNRVHNLGMARDMCQRKTLARVDDNNRRGKVIAARRIIYEKNYQINSAAVDGILQSESLVPNVNAFSDRLSPFGFNLYKMLVPDLMHEFELGVWRAIFIHLLRILQSIDEDLIVELDRRFREIPSFGGDTIRRFAANCSELKKMAAHNFENLLQCAFTVFDGLLPEPHNRTVTKLLFALAHWHALAKLRMHNDLTLDIMDAATISLGKKLREFNQKTCTAFETKELSREYNARMRKHAKAASKTCIRKQADTSSIIRNSGTTTTQSTSVGANDSDTNLQAATDSSSARVGSQLGRRRKTLNLNTFKTHSLGDYADMIRTCGTTDSVSTEPGELEHRKPKSRYKRTSGKGFLKQMTKIERRQARLRRIRARYQKAGKPANETVATSPEAHHVIGVSQNFPENIPVFLQKNKGDPAIIDFIPKLKDHILPRIKEMLRQEVSASDADGNSPQAGLSAIQGLAAGHELMFFKDDRMYRHNLARFNYTTYDIRRSQDVINPGTTHRDIMLLANNTQDNGNTTHPFLYARVLGIYHVNVIYTRGGSPDYVARKVEFLWVRWFEYDSNRSVEWADLKLDPIRFFPMADKRAFGFIDPKDVLRGCHVLPAFVKGKARMDGVGLSNLAHDAQDWSRYRVNRFVDRDMFMRYYWGLAAGHTYTHSTGNGDSPTETSATSNTTDETDDLEPETSSGDFGLLNQLPGRNDDDVQHNNDAEFSFENRQDDIFDEADISEDEGGIEGDDEFFAMHDMYGINALSIF